MNTKQSKAELIGRRAELMAELFLQELEPSFVAKPTSDFGFDLFVGFQNKIGGINSYAIEVKGTDNPISSKYRMHASTFKRLANSNIPALLLVVDVKENNLFYSWIEREAVQEHEGKVSFSLPVIELNELSKNELKKKLLEG